VYYTYVAKLHTLGRCTQGQRLYIRERTSWVFEHGGESSVLPAAGHSGVSGGAPDSPGAGLGQVYSIPRFPSGTTARTRFTPLPRGGGVRIYAYVCVCVREAGIDRTGSARSAQARHRSRSAVSARVAVATWVRADIIYLSISGRRVECGGDGEKGQLPKLRTVQ